MADRIKTIGVGGDYADPILWAAAEGNIDDGNRAVGKLISDVEMSGLFRPNQLFPNGGLLLGDLIVTGKVGDGRALGNTNGARICLAPSPNLDFQDLEFPKGVNSMSIQSMTGSNLTRILTPDLTILPIAPFTSVMKNVVLGSFDLNTGASSTAKMTNILATQRMIIRAGEKLEFKNSVSTATDWLLGRGTYVDSETLVNDCYITQNAASGDFGPGSSGNTVNFDVASEMVDFVGGDYRIKSTSPLAAAGIGPFIEESEQTTPIFSFSSTISVSQLLNATTLKAINHAEELSQAVALSAFNVKSININASINQNQTLQALNVKCLMLSTELLQDQQLQAAKSKKIALSGEIQQSYAMQGFFQNGTTEINQFNATISVTPINSAKFNKNVKQENIIIQRIVLTGQAIKRSALQLNVTQTTLLAANAYKHVNVNAELQQNLVTSAIFFNAAQPLYLRKFRINGEIVFQKFNGATVKQRFNGALN